MSIRDDILRNEETLSHLDQDLYPSLKKLFKKTKIIQHLNGIMGHMMSYTFAMWPEVNRRYYLFSTTHLQNWAKENTRIKSSSKTWQGHIIALELMGLIKIIRVTGPSGDEILDSIYTKAVERATANNWKKVISETLWSVPLYTEKILAQADSVAKLFIENRVNLSHLNKDDVIGLFDQEKADMIYHDQRVVSHETQIVTDVLERVIKAAVEEKGYASKHEVGEQLASTLAREQHFFFPDPDRQHEWTTEDLNEIEREKRYKQEIKKAMNRLKAICGACGCDFVPIKREQMERFGLSGHSWIIVPRDRHG